LRLCFATPRRWLEDGKAIEIRRAPTAFGQVSVRMASRLSQNEITADVYLPERNKPARCVLRARVPKGWRILSATAEGRNLAVDEEGTVDLSSFKGKVSIVLKTGPVKTS